MICQSSFLCTQEESIKDGDHKSSTLTAQQFYERYKTSDISVDLFEDSDNENGECVDSEEKIVPRKNPIRTVTPIYQVIKQPPSTHEELTKYLRDRLTLQVDIDHVSINDHTQLMDVLTMAIISVWPEYRKQAPDPFLNELGNKELQRRVAVCVIQTSEDLYYAYIKILKELNEKGIFSSEANISRLKTQLLHEANKSLNILRIWRNLAEKMHLMPDEKWFRQPHSSLFSSMLSSVNKYGSCEDLTQFSDVSHQQFIQKQLSELQRQMPSLKTNLNIRKIFPLPSCGSDLFKMSDLKKIENDPGGIHTEEGRAVEVNEGSVVETKLNDIPATIIQRSGSMPSLTDQSELSDEFKAVQKELSTTRKLSVTELLQVFPQNATSVDTLNDDLLILAKRNQDDFVKGVIEEDFSPLLQAHGRECKKTNRQILIKKNTKSDDVELSTMEDKIKNTDLDENMPVNMPNVINVKIPGHGIVRICDVNISNNINETEITLRKYPAMYNEFLNEIDEKTAKSLDQHLFAVEEIEDVYNELTKTMNKDHLCFDKDDYVEPCAPKLPDESMLFVSGMLHGKQQSRIANDELQQDTKPPWNNYDSAEAWRNEPKFAGIGREDILKMIKAYTAWLSCYQNNVTTDDYKKFISTKNNDFLSQIYHLYDSDNETELEEEERARISAQLKILRERKKELRAIKTNYKTGFWNAQSVLMGGLGKDPYITEISDSGSNLNYGSNEEATSSYVLLQERLNQIWMDLKMPQQNRLDMALKYRSLEAIDALTEEDVATLIVQREGYMAKLECFEKTASDPNRFFEKGRNSSSLARITESKTRDKLNKHIKNLDVEITDILNYIKKHFDDDVTYQGRNYLEKLQSDRIEMLYWLQQERRKAALSITTECLPTDSLTPVTCFDEDPLTLVTCINGVSIS